MSNRIESSFPRFYAVYKNRQQNYPMRRYASLGMAMLLGLEVFTGCTSVSAATHPSSAARVKSVESPDTHAKELKTFDHFRNPEKVSDELVNDVSLAALKLTIQVPQGEASCTANMVNGFLISAGHCLPPGSHDLTVSRWQDDFKMRGSVINTAISKGTDIAVSKVKWVNDPAAEWNINLQDKRPPLGTRFVMANLPGGANEPVVSGLKLIGER